MMCFHQAGIQGGVAFASCNMMYRQSAVLVHGTSLVSRQPVVTSSHKHLWTCKRTSLPNHQAAAPF